MDTKAPIEPEQSAMSAIKAQKKKIIVITAIAVACCVVVLVWYFIAMAQAKKADEAIALADTELNDSIALNYYMDAAKLGTKSGNRAGIEAGIRLYKAGKYQEALDYLKDASSDSEIIEAGRLSLMGDCYVNLNNNTEAISCFKKAASEAKGNAQVAPFILVKLANVYRVEGNFNDEYKAYKEIIDEYPTYVQSLRTDIRKYAERAKASAEQK